MMPIPCTTVVHPFLWGEGGREGGMDGGREGGRERGEGGRGGREGGREPVEQTLRSGLGVWCVPVAFLSHGCILNMASSLYPARSNAIQQVWYLLYTVFCKRLSTFTFNGLILMRSRRWFSRLITDGRSLSLHLELTPRNTTRLPKKHEYLDVTVRSLV